MKSIVITIDGPAGAGKTTSARALAQRLGYELLDTGAMYRAVALAALRRGIALDQPELLAALARDLDIVVDARGAWVDGCEVTKEIRAPEVTKATSFAAASGGVREQLVELQRRAARGRNIVTEGRDQGTVVFPDAVCKFFLTANNEERARRRWEELIRAGANVTLDQVRTEQDLRDQQDSQRAIGPLIPAPDAVHVDTDALTTRQVVERMLEVVQARIADS